MANVTRQESVAAVTFDAQDIALPEKKKRDALLEAKGYGERICGAKALCDLECHLGKAAVTYRCQRLACPNPNAVVWAAGRAIDNLAFLTQANPS